MCVWRCAVVVLISGKRSPSFIPLCGLCLVGYYTLMRPDNNRSLDWEEITLDPATMRGTFKLDQHKSSTKASRRTAHSGVSWWNICSRFARLTPPGRSTRTLRPAGPTWTSASSGNALLAVAAEMLGYELTGKKAKFLNFRHTGASHIAQRGRAAPPPARGREDDGDTSVATVNRHYFNLEDDVMQEIIDGWAVPDVEVFAPDLEPVCAASAPDDDKGPATPVQPSPHRARK
jgi:integrase